MMPSVHTTFQLTADPGSDIFFSLNEKNDWLGRLDYWDLLARGCMTAHKHCRLCLPSSGSAKK